MANQRVSNTALGAAICRFIEQYQPKNTRLFDDPLVKDLITAPIRTLMQIKGMRHMTIQQMDAITPGIYGVQIARTRFIDEAVRDAISQGIEQVVILGAGLDTRSYRLAGIEHTRVFEVDLPSVQEAKMKKLRKHFGQLPQRVTFLPIDFDTQSLEAVFSKTSYDFASPAIFVWEGVTQYLSEEAVRRALAFVGVSAPGSMLVFTYVLQSFIERRSAIPGTEKMMDMMAKRGAPWLFGLEPSSLTSYLSPFHLHLIADVGHVEHQAHYFKPVGRKLAVSEIERIAQATVVHP
ncbi:SAM-dependent methyltransferase [Ktedonospora formicarum]|uniref:S-adenosyl-L-methionine-dependent methyltransferase n=1 Tax=Ktedonospora formicarum TaxID=2778364 RepID=A0A8J3MYR2_9CHLR|nr:class I SAM-dependent methyltransferase [Ktedonospora formicarum]GHO51088.1 S-adenosyl-L-methionine-dependent methyltransferase [Ktedonospora formicarum]